MNGAGRAGTGGQTGPTKGPRAYYMYVLSCADGSWYTGFTTDVARRVAAHNAGHGAKYTKTRRPVTLVAQAEFATEREARSAEWHFKRLSRAEKERLVSEAVKDCGTRGEGAAEKEGGAPGEGEAAKDSEPSGEGVAFAHALARELGIRPEPPSSPGSACPR